MRSHRTQKKISKTASGIIEFAPTFTFSRYENFEVATKEATGFKALEKYVAPTAQQSTESAKSFDNVAISDFSEELKFQRRSHVKSNEDSTFTVTLAYEKDDSDKYKCVDIIFNYKKDTTSGATESLESAELAVTVKDPQNADSTLDLKVEDLDLDSDITEYLFRFTRGLAWGSATYAILDCNANESVNKGIYLTMNAPFNYSIQWGDEVRKLILAYKFSN